MKCVSAWMSMCGRTVVRPQNSLSEQSSMEVGQEGEIQLWKMRICWNCSLLKNTRNEASKQPENDE